MTPGSGSPEANAALVRETLAAFNAGDLDTCLARLTPDFVMHFAELPEPLHGGAIWRQGAGMMRSAFPDLEGHIEDVVAAGDRVALRISFTGTHLGTFHLGASGSLPATGRTIRYVSHEFYRVSDGLIAEEWICSDMASLLHQLG
jgi:steroid delta-isomerase-like uncharacterized protein